MVGKSKEKEKEGRPPEKLLNDIELKIQNDMKLMKVQTSKEIDRKEGKEADYQTC